jgi:hypothetical protein
MHEHGSLPRARKDGLLEETVGEEILLYDRDSHTAHCLSPIAACVWRHCDGEHDATELAELAGASEHLVADALHELREKDLLDAEPALTQSTIPGVSRREAIVRVARVAGAAAGASLIVSATAATPAMAESKGSCSNCKTEFCCQSSASDTCCCCNDSISVTAVTLVQSCAAACAGHMGVWTGAGAERQGFKAF